nr:hypothetical protein GCM10017745_10010 [Saccharothrix mutabilis subsp. capreolus]
MPWFSILESENCAATAFNSAQGSKSANALLPLGDEDVVDVGEALVVVVVVVPAVASPGSFDVHPAKATPTTAIDKIERIASFLVT